jgi:hypothetical protein
VRHTGTYPFLGECLDSLSVTLVGISDELSDLSWVYRQAAGSVQESYPFLGWECRRRLKKALAIDLR